MTIYQIPYNLNKTDYPSWDLEDKTLIKFNRIDNYESIVIDIKEKSKYLNNLPIKYLL